MFVILGFSGCVCKPKVVTKVVEQKVAVKCKVPKVECNFEDMNNINVVSELIRCVYAHKKAAKVCQ